MGPFIVVGMMGQCAALAGARFFERRNHLFLSLSFYFDFTWILSDQHKQDADV